MQTNTLSNKPIGIFDSGVGGLSILRAMRKFLPAEHILYTADQAHIPYGPRQREDIRDFAFGITEFLLDRGAKLIVVACNTASAVALHDLRARYPEIPFVGMEPAVKPAAAQSQTGRVGVLATPTTFAGEMYHALVNRFAQGIQIYQNTCPGLVEQIERGELEAPATRAILEAALQPMLAENVDTIVLGCTHYPFVIPLIQDITGPDVHTIDPAPAIARQTQRLLDEHGWLNTSQAPGRLQFFTSGESASLEALLLPLLGETGIVTPVVWENSTLKAVHRS
ncbi:MAG TPA: glutamate racemase [Brevefilum fermentans]|jgi:glutamate racemase|uniref:Glutamate racemase n=1 Tax=Candidatus Brevifilum fermentans TaxID=1986204 RepID=A0A1Y6K9V1_9CHLR|nr:glutamate racemase [Brevefilum fermentans]MDI9566597.1 glutamate racemase [Chloroflexota bacterium]OQB86224.1 MAG: Glutamate racemase [Chloroflexi bacterium ADurb.Bin120]SMX55349.1 Glutamate racemase [Brevefilum fermentans]HOM67210.1 glutamate racemase [Brevefilum fermentans]HPX95874.1 glutamate racemase [Brevefilum fermentans]